MKRLDEATQKALGMTEETKETKNEETKEVQKDETKKTKKLNDILKEQGDLYSIDLGKNKKLNLEPWKGKTKKKLRKVFEGVTDVEEIDFERVMEILLYDHLGKDNKSTVYLNTGEQLAVLSALKSISTGAEFKTDSFCPVCDAENTFKVNLYNITEYKDNELPSEEREYNKGKLKFKFIDIKSFDYLKETFEEYQSSDDYDGYTELIDAEKALHIDLGKPLKDTIEILDDTPINEVNKIMEDMDEYLPDCKVQKEHRCKVCNKTSKFDVEIIKTVIAEFMGI
jgi:hypothetical protein